MIHLLPREHPLRNAKLADIKAQYKSDNVPTWREVYPNFGIASITFNDLTDVWTANTQWKTDVPDWDEKRIDIIGQNGNDGIHYDAS